MFKDDLLKLAAGDYESWKHDHRGRLAAVILTDQFSRQIFRKQGQAFAYDHIALAIVKGMTKEEFWAYGYVELAFLMMPYEHSESAEDQTTSVTLFREIGAKAIAEAADESLIKFYNE